MERLLDLARESILTAFKDDEPDINDYLDLKEERGVFVTLHKNGELRGCIGYPDPVMPLYRAVKEAARGAAFKDPRFPKVTPDEMRSIRIEVSVLSVPERIDCDPEEYTEKIELGKDGLILEGPKGTGLLLPQVAIENDFTKKQFLNCLSQKAGLPFNAWEDPDYKLFKFQARVYNERDQIPT